MAANKFASMVQRNSNRMTLVLVYVLLEWILIALLLLNSLFSFLILRFAHFFGLARPCLWCSSLDPAFSPRDLLCHAHAAEVSNLTYCAAHRKLAEAGHVCEDCSAPSEPRDWPERFPLFPGDSKCCCCGMGVSSRGFYSPCIVIKPWGALDYPEKKKGLIVDDKSFEVDQSRSDIAVDRWRDELVVEETGFSDSVPQEVGENVDKLEEDEQSKVEASGEILVVSDSAPRVIEAVEGNNVDKLEEDEQSNVEETREVPVVSEDVPREIEAADGENVDKLEEDEQSKVEIPFQHLEFFIGQEDCTLIPVEEEEEEEEEEEGSSGNCDVILDFDTDAKAQAELVTENWHSSPDSLELIQAETTEPLCISQGTQTVSDEESGDNDEGGATGPFGVDADAQQGSDDEIDGEISIGTDIPDHEIESEDPSSTSINLLLDLHHELNLEQAEDEPLEFKPLCVQRTGSENEIEEENVPDTPTSVDSLHLLHGRTDLEESLDGSVLSDTEGVEGIPTVERLRAALKDERKALNALYMELEEERSASAVAASQTMAMINRLQEEKAAMQMEALQYQRMMEEQSEYDQEALQLLNELMMKREREKQELEKKVLEYEARERMALLRRSRNSSACCSNTEDSDGISIDTNHEAKEDGEEHEDDPNTPEEAVHCLEESLVGFEEERLSILDQLRALEEKLFSLSDGEKDEYSFEDVKLFAENGNGFSNGHFMGVKAKRLLPFFEAEADQENGALDQNRENDYAKIHDETVVFEFDHRETKKLTVEEEVDHVYERLQALEADREFLKHCISSLRKGDKGLFLLREILQHLRDLRTVEHSVKHVGNGVL